MKELGLPERTTTALHCLEVACALAYRLQHIQHVRGTPCMLLDAADAAVIWQVLDWVQAQQAADSKPLAPTSTQQGMDTAITALQHLSALVGNRQQQ